MESENQTNGITLLPCPFCGGEAETWDGAGPWYAVCTRCGAVGSPHLTEAEAIAAWNTRTASGDDFSRAVHDGHLWRLVKDHIKCQGCGLNIESVIPLDGCNENAIRHCPNCGRRVVNHD